MALIPTSVISVRRGGGSGSVRDRKNLFRSAMSATLRPSSHFVPGSLLAPAVTPALDANT